MDTEHNPFAPPQAQSLYDPQTETDGEMEEVRRRFINREACIKALGCLYVLSGAGSLLSCLVALAAITGSMAGLPRIGWFALAQSVVLGVFFLWAGTCLFRLKNVARLAAIGACALFVCIGLALGNYYGIPVQGAYLACLIGSGARYVCSAEYLQVIAQTRGLNGQVALRVVLLVIGLIVVLFAIGILQVMRAMPAAFDQA